MHSRLITPSQAMQAAAAGLLSFCLAIVIAATSARAHELTPAIADLTFEEGAYSVRIEVVEDGGDLWVRYR